MGNGVIITCLQAWGEKNGQGWRRSASLSLSKILLDPILPPDNPGQQGIAVPPQRQGTQTIAKGLAYRRPAGPYVVVGLSRISDTRCDWKPIGAPAISA